MSVAWMDATLCLVYDPSIHAAHIRHLKHFLLPLVLDLVSAFGLIPQQYSLTSADGIQRDVLIKTRLPFHRFVLHPSSCLFVCEVQVSAVMQDPVRPRCQGLRVQHGVNGETGLSTEHQEIRRKSCCGAWSHILGENNSVCDMSIFFCSVRVSRVRRRLCSVLLNRSACALPCGL